MRPRRWLRVKNWPLAIGEFVLIFVGILAALAADDWNTRRLERQEEVEILRSLHSALNTDWAQLDSLSSWLGEKHERILTLQQHLSSGGPYADSLDVLFGAVYGFKESVQHTGPYEALKARGFDLVSNDSLRIQIIRVYDELFGKVQIVEERHRTAVLDVFRPYFLQHFSGLDFNNSASPLNYERLLQDQYFLNLVEYRAAIVRLDKRPAYDTAAAGIDDLIQALERELEDRGR